VTGWPDPVVALWRRFRPVRALAILGVGLTCGAAALAQTTYWLGRVQGTNYVFDLPLPAEFAQKALAADPSRYVIDKSPRDLPRGAVPLAAATFTYDLPMFKSGSIALERKPGTQDMLWIEARLGSEAGKPLASQLPVPQAGQWESVTLVFAIAPDARPLTLNVPVPQTILAQQRMKTLGQQTRPGGFYPGVKVPADLDGYRQQMLAYGNAGRRDPDFRKANGALTVLDLRMDMVDTYTDQSKTRMQKEKVFRHSPTPPYFTDHVLNAKLNDAAQFQAEYNASINTGTHAGPSSFVFPATGKPADMSTLGKRAAVFGVSGVAEGAGAAALGGAPHNWMTADTPHFRPFFNVVSCFPEIGYGAAQSASGKWYFIMVARADHKADCASGQTLGALPGPTTPAVATSPPPPPPPPPPSTSPAPVVAAAAADFPLRAGTKLESGRKYRSESGQHVLVLQADGNLVVYDAAGRYKWGLDKLPNYKQIKTVELQSDGNLVARDASGGFVWSAMSRTPDPSAFLSLGQDGVLRLVSGRGNAQLWASSGEAGPSGSAGTAPQAPAQTAGTPQWEVGKQYALRDRSGFRYVKLISIDTSAGTRYLFGACPTSLAQGVALDPKVVMRVSDARAQGLTQLLEPCDLAQVPLGR